MAVNGGENGTKIAAAAQSLKDLNWPTVVLIAISGGTNFFATQQNSAERQYQEDVAIRKVSELHDALEETDKRQRTALDNQRQLLEHDSKLLIEVHEIATKLERLKQLDQMRGAPE
jgi:hypothetical protein